MKLSDIKGIKLKRIEALQSVGIISPVDLLSFFPKKYIDKSALTNIDEAKDGDEIVILAKTKEKPKVNYIRRNMSIVRAKFLYCGKNVNVVYYNQPFMAKNIVVGKEYFICGKYSTARGCMIINATLIPRNNTDRPIPIYPKIKGLPANVLTSAIDELLENIDLVGYIPADVCDEYNLQEINSAYALVHHPNSMADIADAKRTVSIEYLNYLISVYSLVRNKKKLNKKCKYNAKCDVSDLINVLPYKLTEDQISAVHSIVDDLKSGGCNRLIQGDVGCGKTIVAFCAMYFAHKCGYQSVLMVPTEVLAVQHYLNAKKIFEKFGVNVVCLTGNTNGEERESVLHEIKSGNANIIIGTHALFSDEVIYKNLTLIVTDEQQRFGVKQRSLIETKAIECDTVVMSATPIPRTLALTLYGDLQVSTIRSIPQSKAQTLTRFVISSKEDDMWSYVYQKAQEGFQTYVVCPRIEDNEDNDLVSAVDLFKKHEKKFGSQIGLLHGKLSEKSKNQVMSDFVSGKIKVLISTTVIEVGVDVKNATTIIIYNAERFGLSQLHQLRGRVGRGKIDSYCFVLSNVNIPSVSERLTYFCKCNDGFELSEYDFKVRGSGDFIGTEQHGKSGDFSINEDNIKVAKEISDRLITDPTYRMQIESTITDNRYDYFKEIVLN